jgi:predicted DNA-binding transcriptional regulator YafY
MGKKKQAIISRRDRTREHEAEIAFIHNQILNGGFPTCAGLAKDLGISERAVKRHIRAMKVYRDLPIKTSRKAGQEGYYYETPVAPLIGRTFTEIEVVKLFMGHNILNNLPVKKSKETLGFGFDKISQLLDLRTKTLLLDLKGTVFFRPFAPEAIDVDTFLQLAESVRTQTSVTFCYTKHMAAVPELKTVHPYCFTLAASSWYLIAYDPAAKDMRTYMLSRLTSAVSGTEKFKKPKSFYLDDYLDGAFIIMKGKESHDVVIEFDSWAAPYIRNRKFTRDQKIEELGKGALRISMHLTCLEEVEAWICYWRTHAKAVGPTALVNRLHDYGQYLIGAHPKVE